ncbi:MAG: type II secretion system protein [Planctomycetota bacterium]|nr:type II secretion system protein [Planctomycetota bacterium]
MNSQFNQQRQNARSLRRAFTLVEMLVAMTLVLLMMTLFGEIFSLATGSMNLQRAIAENDQQIRTLTTVLRGDLQKRTFRNVVPFFPLENQDDPTTSFHGREGYFYISLNSSNNAVDNVLQFTVRSTILDELIDDTPYYGAATTLGGSAAFLANGNQPEHDDGEINPNGAGASTAAEVCYFVRSGNLYRRQLLIREPLAATGADTEQPTRSDGADFFVWNLSASPPAPVLYTGDFWDDFDYAAFSRYAGDQQTGAGFVGTSALSNEYTAGSGGANAVPNGSVPVSLGQSRFRFGFNSRTGISREFGDSTGTFFIGRFTQEETSASNFNYPHMASEVSGGGSVLGDGNPMDAVGTELNDLVDETGGGLPDGRVDEFQRNASTGVSAGARVGEDLLLTNVHEFRIDVWDQRISQYVPIGHSDTTVDGSGAVGDFHTSRQLNSSFAPVGGSSNAFDTWHPAYDRDNADGDWDDTTQPDNPPFRPMTWDPMGISAPVPFNSGPDSFWDQTGMTTYAANDVVFPPTEDANLDGFWDVATEDANSNGQYDKSGPVDVHGRVYSYRCVEAGAGPSISEPPWGSTPGQYHRTADGYLWQVQSNLRPLKAIRITVRFLHRRSGKMRQMTLIQPLTK